MQASDLIVVAREAHPDDIAWSMAGTLIRLARAGAEVHNVSGTSGQAGIAGKTGAQAAAIRVAESRAAGSVIGATECHVLDGHDSELSSDIEHRKRLIALLRKIWWSRSRGEDEAP